MGLFLGEKSEIGDFCSLQQNCWFWSSHSREWQSGCETPPLKGLREYPPSGAGVLL